MRHAREFAAALGTTLGRLRKELQARSIFPPKLLLKWLRVLMASRFLGDSPHSIERVGLLVGYTSGPAFYHAYNGLLAVTPHEVQERGGLRYTATRYQTALAEWRSVAVPRATMA